MAHILILYSSFDGQTLRIAERISATLAKAGHTLKLRDAAAPEAAEDILAADAVIVGGAIRYGRFDAALVQLVSENAPVLDRRPNAFFSVSLSAVHDANAAKGCMAEFVKRTQWRPERQAVFAGALRYRQYTPFVRFLMRLIAYANDEATDTSRDHEYTDWPAVERFAEAFAVRLPASATA
jgi:menaquinone-dependent protoporphyrinogen oxidase